MSHTDQPITINEMVTGLPDEVRATISALKAELAAVKPLIDWAKNADPSLIAHLTTATRKDKCSSCDEASALVLRLADILTDLALRKKKGEK